MRTLPWAVAVSLMLANGAGAVEGGVTAEQFLRFIKAQQSLIRDVAFAFEGEDWELGPHEEPHMLLVKYQGRYSLRSDGSTYMEHYHEFSDERRDLHIVQAMLRGQGEKAMVSPAYFAQSNPPVRKFPAGPGSFFIEYSPEWFHFLWRFQRLQDVSDFGYQFIGWEDVDGHRCAHIEFDPHPNISIRVRHELWVDLERGGHPLRIRNSVGEDTIFIIDQIGLEQFTLPSGEKIWFPIGGRYSKYHRKGEYTTKAVSRATIHILNGTLVFNQGLGDGVFRVIADRFRPAFTPPPPTSAERSNRGPGFDVEDAEEKLDAALADPARSKLAMDATTATRAESFAWSLTAWGLGLGGLAAVILAGFLALRRST